MKNDSYSADNKGLRYDQGKTQYHLIPGDGLSELARVYMFGAKKYAPYNWERGMDHSRVFNSLLRHLYAYWDGETRDAETGLHHMAHCAWNAMALLVYSLRGVGVDDRKASLLSAQQNKEAAADSGLVSMTLTGVDEYNNPKKETCQVERLKTSVSGPELKGLVDRSLPPVTNPFALKRRIDLPAAVPTLDIKTHKVRMRCYNCPNDALPHHAVCQECLDESNKVYTRSAE